ncbi:MAG: hypothetical protein F2743_08615 [Actinobacteria bacterium]|nr:hypothetical protein [Actinomycetota bacterium]
MGNLVFQAALGGQVALSGPNTASSYTITVPTVTGTMITTGDTGTVTNTMLVNSTISGVALGGSLFNLTAGTNISFSTGTTYNGSAAITINGTSAQVYPGAGIANSTGTAWGTSYTTTGTGTVVALATSPTFVTPILGTPTSGTLTNTTGFPAANLAGTALPSAIVTSSLTALGTIATGVWNGTAIGIAYGGTGQATASAGFNALSPITTTGDLILGNGTNSATRLAIGANTYVLTSNGTTASWVAPSGGGGSQATATALGTVYAKQTTGGGTPYLTAFGYNAGVSTTGDGNSAFGTQALYTNSTGTLNTAVGYQSLYVSNGSNNTAIGEGSLTANTSGSNNVSVGLRSLYTNTTGANNTACGRDALRLNLSASNNTALGFQAGYEVTGTGNVLLGYGAGYAGFGNNLTTGSNNIIIGASSPSVSSTTYEIIIGSGVNGKGASTGFITPNGGGVYQGNNSTLWSVTSDQRLKKNIVDNNVGLDKVVQIQVRNFEYRNEDEVTDLPKNQTIKKEGLQLGVIAQELQQILPDCVKQESTGVLAVDSTDVMWYMINAIKELNAEVQSLKAKLGA